jgi:hypothetical protein
LTRHGINPTDPSSQGSVIGVWASASRQAAVVHDGYWGNEHQAGEWMQVSRLGNPLFNEVIVPIGEKDNWNALRPIDDNQFLDDVNQPELAKLLPVLYPGVFPHLAAYKKDRVDLAAILLTGIPKGIIPGFQNFTGKTLADQLRLNVAIPPSKSPNRFGLLGSDLAGFPNGRRVFDDIVAVELRAVAGATIPLVDPTYKPDAAAGLLTQWQASQEDPGGAPGAGTVPGPNRYLPAFPYLGDPYDGFDTPSS